MYHSLDASADGKPSRVTLCFSMPVQSTTKHFSRLRHRFPTSNIPITGNRTDSSTIELRPYWEQSIGDVSVYLAAAYLERRYDNDDIENDEFLVDNDQHGVIFNLNNHERGEGLAWGVDYYFKSIDYESTLIPWEYQRASADVGYWFSSAFRGFVMGGIETPYDNFQDSSLEDEFWEVGFQVVPSARLDMELAAGQRGFGNTFRADIAYQLRKGETALTYTQEPSTRGEDWYDYRPLSSTDNLFNPFDRPGATDRFIREYGEWVTSITTGKKRNFTSGLYRRSSGKDDDRRKSTG